jgi:hypothetical protein
MRRALVLSLFLGACVSTKLAPGADAVRVTANTEAVKGCRFVKEVKGADHWNGGVLSGKAEENANRQLKNEAVSAGANVVLVTSSSTGHNGSDQRGEAYACSQ